MIIEVQVKQGQCIAKKVDNRMLQINMQLDSYIVKLI